MKMFKIVCFFFVFIFQTSCAMTISETRESYEKIYKLAHQIPSSYSVPERLPFTAAIEVNNSLILRDTDDRGDRYEFQAGPRLEEAARFYLKPMFAGEEKRNIYLYLDAYNLEITHKRKEGTIKFLTCYEVSISARIYIDAIDVTYVSSKGSYCADETGLKPKEDGLFMAIVKGLENLRPKIYEVFMFPEKEKNDAAVLMQQEPNNPLKAISLAHLALLCKDYNLAISAAQRTIELLRNPKTLPIPFDLRYADREVINRDLSQAYAILGKTYKEIEQYNEAISNLRKAIELFPKNLSYYEKLSEVLLIQQNFTENIKLWEKAVTAILSWYSYTRLASAYTKVGRYNDAITSLNKAVDYLTITGIGASISIEENYPVVKELHEFGPAKRAGIEVGDKIVKINGQSTKGWEINKVFQNLRGSEGTRVTLTTEKKGEEFEKTITREKIIQKEAASPHGLRSLVYAIVGNIEKSLKDAEMAYALNPNDEYAKRAIGLAYIQKGNPDESLKILASSKEYFDKLLLALAYAKKGSFAMSSEIYRDIPEDYLASQSVFSQDFRRMVLQTMKPYIEGKRSQVKTLEAKGQYKEALKEYSELIRFADDRDAKEIRSHVAKLLKERPYLLEIPEEVRKFAIKAEEYTKEGKFIEAVNEYKKALKISPFLPDLYKALALNYAGMKHYAQAIDNMKIYLELYPNAPDARAARDEIYRWEVQMEKEGKR